MYRQLLTVATKRVELYGAQYVPFGIFGVINYPLSFLMWHHIVPQQYTSLMLRAFITLLCIPLALAKYWPQKLKVHQPVYWYCVIWFSIPFFGVFMLLRNHLSPAWLMNEMLGLFLFILLVDWLSFIVILFTGAVAAAIVFKLSSAGHTISFESVILAVYMYLLVVIIGIVFSRNKENSMLRKQIETARLVSSCVAHELRSPLASIRAGLEMIHGILPALSAGYRVAASHSLVPATINVRQEKGIERTLENCLSELHASNTVINLILHNLGKVGVAASPLDRVSIKDCVSLALERYPFDSSDDQKLVINMVDKDFILNGDQDLLVHVLFNLLKNALFYIKKVEHGQIFIRTETSSTVNKLIFKDTGPGIPTAVIGFIFNRFYSTRNSAGVGLAFVSMVMKHFKGKITCRSKEGEYTEFTLYFPIVAEK